MYVEKIWKVLIAEGKLEKGAYLMNSLWVVNKNCGQMHFEKFGIKSTGGLWLDAMIDQAKQFQEDKIVIVNIEKNPKLQYLKSDNVIYYSLHGEPNSKYAYRSDEVVNEWKKIIEKESPDIIELWGTEFPYGLAVMKAAPKIPVVIFVQGILDSIARYYKAGLSERELHYAVTIRDVLTGTTISKIQKSYQQQAEYELEMVRLAKNIIIENHWAEAYYRRMLSDVKVFRMPISISDSFKQVHWKEEKMIPHTIMCPAANYPIKGLHILLKAVALVKKKYTDVLLKIPGSKLVTPKTFKQHFKLSGYDRLILSMINKYNLVDNVLYVGRLTAEQMAGQMAISNCFTMCSAIENHSMTLKEAMATGVPCISSYVGGVPEYAEDGKNSLLYRFEDYEVLAEHIIRLFEDQELRKKLSENERASIAVLEKRPAGYKHMRRIYRECIERKGGDNENSFFD